jgi:hypothetical protein
VSDLNFLFPALQADQAVFLLKADNAMNLILGGKVPDFMIAEAALGAQKTRNQYMPPPQAQRDR